MILADVISAIVEDLQTIIPAVTSKVGAQYIANHEDAPPRLVWVPQLDTFGPPITMSENPRQLLTRQTRVVIHVWGDTPSHDGDLGPIETLIQTLVASIYRVCHGYFEMGTGTWASQTGQINTDGHLYLLEVTFQIPIVDVALPVVAEPEGQVGSTAALPSGDEPDVEIPPDPLGGPRA